MTKYIYDAAGNLLAEANNAGAITRYYIYGLGLTAMVKDTGEIFVYHFDGTGHTVALTNSAKVPVNRYAYSPYGEVLGQDELVPQPFKYAGQVSVFAEASNLYYMRARYYDAETGRFISEDPAGFVDGPNLYAYVGGNPIGAVDPTGQFVILVPGIVGGLVNAGVTAAFGDTDATSLGTAFATGFVAAYVPGGAAALAVRQSARVGLTLAGGAVAGAGENVASQIVNNARTGRSATDISASQVGVAALGGLAATASVLPAGGKVVEQISAGILSSQFGLAAGAANKIISGK